jgi:hypothetical protein
VYSRLPDAHRPPALFASFAAARLGASVTIISLDEQLSGSALAEAAEAADLLYICSHGEFRSHEYKVVLHNDEWYPSRTGLGRRGPSVAVFDTCFTLDPNDSNWSLRWLNGIGPNLRLVLGFGSEAPMDRRATSRALHFIDRLEAGFGLGSAWLWAVHETTPKRFLGAAIAIGDLVSQTRFSDPIEIIERASLADLPLPPLTNPSLPGRPIALRLCH